VGTYAARVARDKVALVKIGRLNTRWLIHVRQPNKTTEVCFEMARYRYQSLATHLQVVIDGIASQQEKHFRNALGGDNPEILRATRAAAKTVLGGATSLVSPPLDGFPDIVRSAILEADRPRGRLDVQMELEVARRFVPRTVEMADRCLALARLALTVSPGEKAIQFLSRVGRCYVIGLFPESVVMCRASLENAVKEKYQRAGKPLPALPAGKSENQWLLERAEVHGWLTRRQRNDARDVYQRANKAVHEDPNITTDALGTIEITLRIVRALYADPAPAA